MFIHCICKIPTLQRKYNNNAYNTKAKMEVTLSHIHGESSFLIPDFCSDVNLVGNLMLNLILRLPLFVGSFGRGIPSLETTSS